MQNKQIIYYLTILQDLIKANDMEELVNIITILDYNDEDIINEIIEELKNIREM